MLALTAVLKWTTIGAILMLLIEPLMMYTFERTGLVYLADQNCKSCLILGNHIDSLAVTEATDVSERNKNSKNKHNKDSNNNHMLTVDQRRKIAQAVLYTSCDNPLPAGLADGSCQSLRAQHKVAIIAYIMNQPLLHRPSSWDNKKHVRQLCHRACLPGTFTEPLQRQITVWAQRKGLQRYLRQPGEVACILVGVAVIGSLLLAALVGRRWSARRQYELYLALVDHFRERALLTANGGEQHGSGGGEGNHHSHNAKHTTNNNNNASSSTSGGGGGLNSSTSNSNNSSNTTSVGGNYAAKELSADDVLSATSAAPLSSASSVMRCS